MNDSYYIYSIAREEAAIVEKQHVREGRKDHEVLVCHTVTVAVENPCCVDIALSSCCSLLFVVVHCCSLLFIVVHCCSLLFIVVHCPDSLGLVWLLYYLLYRLMKEVFRIQA